MALSTVRVLGPVALLLIVAGCDGPAEPARDASTPDGALRDASIDATVAIDGGVDAAPLDAGPPGCLEPELVGSSPTDTLEDALGTATVTLEPRGCLRTYRLASTAMRRDSLPASPRALEEREGAPAIRTGNDLFDALHTLAIVEARENAVAAVSDYAFDEGRPVPCGGEGCFETGRLWNYVWTRDTAYSVDLGLAALDPLRARNSLEFKRSERRGGGGVEIVQDTGSGGSWPISTDRVAWALGAEELLGWLESDARAPFAERTLAALRGTIERDRRVVFEERDGLYRGEQSFLDWREQTYPAWTATDVTDIGASEALSTNLLHLRAIELAASLARETGDDASATRWEGWASSLRTAIHDAFWLESEGLFATYRPSTLDRAPVRRFDLLGQALAILADVASESEATRVLSTYPHLGPGAAPVVHPQQQSVRIYHNRAEWPFVTAYWLRAARHADHDAAGDVALRSLVRAAALNLSNMENLEIASGAASVEDGAFSGPVVNSQRQLWSVAGYLAMVHHVVFGIETEDDALAVRPWVTREMRRTTFANTQTLVLRNFAWRGHLVDVVVRLPDASDGGGSYAVDEVLLDGAPIGARAVREDELGERARIEVILADGASDARTITRIEDPSEWRAIFGPRTPEITGLTREGGRVRVAIALGGEPASDVTLSVYRDGERVADALPGTTTSYLDAATDGATTTHCWAVESCFRGDGEVRGTCSQHSRPSCDWGATSARISVLDASALTAVGGTPITQYGRFHYQGWGDPGHRLESPPFVAPESADYLLQTQYGNGGPIDTGITCALKRVLVEDVASGEIVGGGVLVMPHLGSWDRWGESSLVRVRLERGRSYRFVIQSDDDTVNMSAFQHFADYTAGTGGRTGAFFRVNIAELRVLRL